VCKVEDYGFRNTNWGLGIWGLESRVEGCNEIMIEVQG
jgi:hypothetical protein